MNWDWGDFVSNLVATLLGGILSFLSGYLIFILDWKRRKREQQQNEETNSILQKDDKKTKNNNINLKEIKRKQDIDIDWLNAVLKKNDK
jgi:hypothetical protein